MKDDLKYVIIDDNKKCRVIGANKRDAESIYLKRLKVEGEKIKDP